MIAGGGGMLVLEEYEHAKARGAHIYAELIGYGANSEVVAETHTGRPWTGWTEQVLDDFLAYGQTKPCATRFFCKGIANLLEFGKYIF